MFVDTHVETHPHDRIVDCAVRCEEWLRIAADWRRHGEAGLERQAKHMAAYWAVAAELEATQRRPS
jgi:hypothetical protein